MALGFSRIWFLCKWILPETSLLVFEEIKVGVAGRAGQVLARYADE